MKGCTTATIMGGILEKMVVSSTISRYLDIGWICCTNCGFLEKCGFLYNGCFFEDWVASLRMGGFLNKLVVVGHWMASRKIIGFV